MDLGNVESTVSQKDIYTGKYISLKVCTVEKQKGYAQRELVEHNGTLMIISLSEDNKLVLDKIYRKSIEKFSLEVPNKRIDSSENHIDVLKTQMMEELGYEIENIKKVFSFYPAVSYSDEKVHLYFAKVKKVEENIENDSCTTIEVSLDDVVDYIKNQDILDGKSIVAINFLKNNIENLGV
ncbi:hydrolase, NUDIX family [[Eubacterium] yurii subsp. margaretiae ATCC 43715]|nr:hydrolase, NUDIX family [[Eubacterium] yurii subsp. margaretiae ATCC 43715]